jgi:RNA methyltransferase, TrmH family
MLTRAQEKLVRGLGQRGRREEERLFLAEGVRVVEELLNAGIVLRFALVSSVLEDTERGQALAHRLAAAAPVHAVTGGELNQLAGTRSPQGVLVVAEIPPASLAELQPRAAATTLVLDGVQDPGNIGTLARTAAAFGCGLLACLPGTVDPWNPKSVRASAGALFRLPVVTVSGDELWAWLGTHEFRVLGADAAGVPVQDRPPGRRAALVVGNEGGGLTARARDRCDALVAVPMRGGTESLNVAVAAGILLYELSRGGD